MDALLTDLSAAPTTGQVANGNMQGVLDRMYAARQALDASCSAEIREAWYKNWRRGSYPDVYGSGGQSVAFYGAIVAMAPTFLDTDEFARFDRLLTLARTRIMPPPVNITAQNELKRIFDQNR